MLPEEEWVAMIRKCFEYRDEGGLWWRCHPNPQIMSRQFGNRFGCVRSHGYREGSFLGAQWLEHHLVWIFHHGKLIPQGKQLDHINQRRTDNRIENLRLVTHSQNGKNQKLRRDNYIGVRGVRRHQGRWEAYITIDGQKIYLGIFDDLVEARAARLRAEALYYGEFASEEAKALARRRF